jgi:ATP-dependent RNA helicase DeaD
MADIKQTDPKSYTSVVDLTSRAIETERREKGLADFRTVTDDGDSVSVDQLPERCQSAVEAAGWTTLTPVQRRAIPLMLRGDDLIVQSQTGSGKTGAFLVPLFERIDPDRRETQVLILAPTRELARQIHAEYDRMRPDDDRYHAALVYGGVRYQKQLADLTAGAPVVIGTPGRVLDHLERRAFSLSGLDTFILDEADEMLSMGFYPAMMKLARYLPAQRASCMFSATIPVRVQGLARQFLTNPVFVPLSAGSEAVDTMDHRYFVVPGMGKDRALIRIIEMENPESAIIFTNTRREVDYVTQFLKNYGHNADGLSGDLSQAQREIVMADLKSDRLRFLVSTDVAARGIDISDLSHVFMYDVPQDHEYYIHRSGRTARAGKSGIVIVLATMDTERALQAMAKRYAVDLHKSELPTEAAVTERVGERLTVLLEEQFRGLRNLERERMSRFVELARNLADEEPELIAMLLDRLYHEQLHESAERREAADSRDKSARRSEEQGGGEEASAKQKRTRGRNKRRDR